MQNAFHSIGLNIKNDSKELISHVIPCDIDLEADDEILFQTKSYQRQKDCFVLLEEDNVCRNCEQLESKNEKAIQKQKNPMSLHPNEPLSKVNPERIIANLKEQRKENKELRNQIDMITKETELKGVIVDNELGEDIMKIMDNHNSTTVSPFMKLFWEQQRSLFGKGTTQC